MQQLLKEGDYFSMDSMRERLPYVLRLAEPVIKCKIVQADSYLHYQMVGRFESADQIQADHARRGQMSLTQLMFDKMDRANIAAAAARQHECETSVMQIEEEDSDSEQEQLSTSSLAPESERCGLHLLTSQLFCSVMPKRQIIQKLVTDKF